MIVRNAAYVVTGVMSALGSYTDPWNLRAEYNPAQAAGTVDLDEPVPLSALYEAPPPEEAEMAMTVLPGCPVENVGEGLGVSDYTESLISLQKSMARLATQRDIAIVINEMPAMNVPAHCLNPDGTLDLGKIWVTMTDPGADPKDQIPINFNNWTGNLNESARQWELNDAAFYALTGLSPAIDGKSDRQRRGKRLCAHAGHGEAMQRHRDAPAALGTGVRLADAGGAATGDAAGAGELWRAVRRRHRALAGRHPGRPGRAHPSAGDRLWPLDLPQNRHQPRRMRNGRRSRWRRRSGSLMGRLLHRLFNTKTRSHEATKIILFVPLCLCVFVVNRSLVRIRGRRTPAIHPRVIHA